MDLKAFGNPALAVALALAAGMLAQAAARHLRIPGIVLLLAVGVALGPDVAGVVQPRTLGAALPMLVGFAVAVILFEGGMNLDLRRLRREARSIRQLVTLGALVTAAGGAAAAHLVLGWSPRLSLLFGTLVIVTGPTVITPLLRRIRVKTAVATVLEAEGVFGDAIGALIAVVALEVTLAPGSGLLSAGAWGFASRLGLGALTGLAGGLAIAGLLRARWLPDGLENVGTLSLVLVLYQASNAILPESGIVSVIVAGLVAGNASSPAMAPLKEFKEQLTVLFIGMLFVLLAADVRLAEIGHLGWPGLATVALLMFVVRPANILVGTLGGGFTLRERAFMAWMAPRGIVAAAVSSHFAAALDAARVPGGSDLRALVFLVIAVTVVVQGLSGGLVARLLGVRRAASGYLILGANGLGRAFGQLLAAAGQEALFLDSNADACRDARAAGFRALHGSALDPSLLARAQLDARLGCLALTSNEEVNYLFAVTARRDWKVPRAWAAVRRGHLGVAHDMVVGSGLHVIFGEPRSLEIWALRLEQDEASIETWHRAPTSAPPATAAAEPFGGPAAAPVAEPATANDRHDRRELLFLPLAVRRGAELLFIDEELTPRPDDELQVALYRARASEARALLAAEGWQAAATVTAAAR